MPRRAVLHYASGPGTRPPAASTMIPVLATVTGGIGLFLLGMVLMTDGLKTLAGDALRRVLARYTGSPLRAVAAGAGVTALVQSSSATTLATIGFVSAGLLGFHNAIGVIIGANLGTTSTGWIVSLLGLKFSIGAFALPLVGVGALLRLVGRERVAQVGLVLAGFGLIFVGIDVLQDGMGGLATRIDLARYSAPGLGPRLLLVGVGVVMTVLMQSSSAAVATTLAALAGGAIGLDQAAALVIGQNIGTTVTAGLAAIGASVPARRTALVHAVFNFGAALIAFAILPLFVDLVERLMSDDGSGADHALTIAAFHTAFNVLGAVVFVPLIPHLAAWAERVLPEHQSPLVRHLDPALREVPALAVAATVDTLGGVLAAAFSASGAALRAQSPLPAARLAALRDAAEAAGHLIERLPAGHAPTLERVNAAFHLLDHVQQFLHAAGKTRRYAALDLLPELRNRASALGTELDSAGHDVPLGVYPGSGAFDLDGGGTAVRLRPLILQASTAGEIDTGQALAALDAQRWLERLAHHARRALHYLAWLQGQAGAVPGEWQADESNGAVPIPGD
jgi:phosphate:Na+ symporter